MDIGELAILDKPNLPTEWDYETSVSIVGGNIYKWKNLTLEIAKELYIAREILSKQGNPTGANQYGTGKNIPVPKTWSNYCEEIGSSRQAVNGWLLRWFGPQRQQAIGDDEKSDMEKWKSISRKLRNITKFIHDEFRWPLNHELPDDLRFELMETAKELDFLVRRFSHGTEEKKN